MQLNIQSHIKNELIRIIREAITAGKIDTGSIRMIVLCTDESFQKLIVRINNEWDTYFSSEYAPVIGEINISHWLDIADEALENKQYIDISYIERAKEIENKYCLTAPAISFEHLKTFDPAYVAFLVCLREDLIRQVETGITKAAISFSQTDFKQIVSFFTYKLTYDLDDLLLQAFSHPEGEGPFYKVELTQPDYIKSDQYLRFYDRGFHMFRVKFSALDDESEKDTEAGTYDISEIEFMFLRDKEFFFRPANEFKNWYVKTDWPDVEKGDKSEQEFLSAVEGFLNKWPDKIFNVQNIPDPITQKDAFDNWFNIVLEYNIPIIYNHLQSIFNYGENAFRYYIKLIPKMHAQYNEALDFLATRLFYLGRFEESLNLFDQVKKIYSTKQIQYLSALYLLNQKERYDNYRLTTDLEPLVLELLDTLWILRKSEDIETLNSIEEKFISLLPDHKNSQTLYLISVILVKVYILKNNKEQALLQLQSIPSDETVEQFLVQHEFKSADYIQQAYEQQIQQWQKRIIFDKDVEKHSLDTSEKKKINLPKTTYEHSYYLTHKIGVSDYKWAHPVNAETFIAINEDNGYQLIILKIITGESLEILYSLCIPTSLETQSAKYRNGTVYIADREQGIVTYNVTETSIEEAPVVYRNKRKKGLYQSMTIADDYLFVSNNNYLEIYSLYEPEAGVVSDSFYISSGYYLFVHNNLLVVGAGGGLLILADVSDKKNPVCLSTIKEDSTPDNMHVEFIDNYLLSRSLYDINNPKKPEWIQFVGEELAPTYYFSPKPEVPVISTAEEFLFTTLELQQNNKPVYTNWRESLNKDYPDYERATNNLATAYFEDTAITYSRYEIKFWKKGLSPDVLKVDVNHEVETIVQNCFNYTKEIHPEFVIGKVVLQYNKENEYIRISFHQSSSPATLTNEIFKHSLPIVSSTFLLFDYYTKLIQKENPSAKMRFEYDGEAIIEKLIEDSRFEKLAARHVITITDKQTQHIQYPKNYWKPFRLNTTAETKEETITEIILSRNEASINQLIDKIADNATLLDELLDILNKKIQRSNFLLFSDEPNTEDSAAIMAEMYEAIDFEDSSEEHFDKEELYCSPEYIIDPRYTPEKKEQKDAIPAGFLPNTMESYELKNRAFEILCKLHDRTLVRNILFNGMKYGQIRYDLKDLPPTYSFDEELITEFVRNNHRIWNEFGSDSDMRLFLMSNIHAFHNNQLQIRIAYQCGHLSHPVITEYIRKIIDGGMTYEAFRGEMTDIDLSTFPEEVIRPFESQLLEKAAAFENTTDALLLIDAEQQLPYIYALLYKLGHEHMPEIVSEKLKQAVKEQEQYGNLYIFDEEYEFDKAFLVRFYRELKIKRLLHYYKDTSDALWPIEEPLEHYTESWKNTIEALLKQGSETYGDSFKKNYIERLAKNILLDEIYANDRKLAYEMIQYTYRNIEKQPQLASLAEPLVLVIHEHKDEFAESLNIQALKDKSIATLLQAAWNDLKDQQLDLAEQKADAVLIMAPNMAQAYFLKARLLWLREGIPAYLAQKEYFIEKAEDDIAALARLYNLTGCALDVEKRYEEALPYFKKAAFTAPNDSMYISNVAEIYYKLGKSKEALQHAKSARANGNEAVILKEIIDNNGVLSGG